jgi:uncharacterized protein YjiS (DUF1127 family)
MATVTANATHRSLMGVILYRAGRIVNGVFAAVARRQTLRELSSLDDHQLTDIGLRRDQLTNSLFASDRFIGR